MTHKDLISLIYKNRNEIDDAYRHERDKEYFTGVNEKLFELGIFKKFGKKIILNKNYKSFVDGAINRVNIFQSFDNYDKDISALKKLKSDFETTQKSFYKDELLYLIEEIFDKIDTQDRTISKLVDNLVSELDFDIDILISRSEDVLKELKELISATGAIIEVLNKKIIGNDEEIDSHAKDLLYNIEGYISNIDSYCVRVSEIIRMNRLKKAQNKKLKKLSKLIFENRDEILIDYLKDNYHSLAFTMPRMVTLANIQNERVQARVTRKVKEVLDIKPDIREYKKAQIGEVKYEEIVYIDLENIVEDLNREGCEDLFNYIKSHKELQNYIKYENLSEEESFEETFKNFLTIVIPRSKNLEVTNRYNEDNIRIVKWIR